MQHNGEDSLRKLKNFELIEDFFYSQVTNKWTQSFEINEL